jgi:uncharacterized protein YigE (DUF2233 family)
LEKKGKKVVFAMNGEMFRPDHSPQGLFIEKSRLITPLDTTTSKGNFYLKPNGVFCIRSNHKAVITKTDEFFNLDDVIYATQSGPMLVVEGSIHPAFKQGSSNLNIRNGVGILPNGDVIFAMSKKKCNFYDFAYFFKRLGCQSALYMDGFISRTYAPEQEWI